MSKENKIGENSLVLFGSIENGDKRKEMKVATNRNNVFARKVDWEKTKQLAYLFFPSFSSLFTNSILDRYLHASTN